MNWTFIGLLFIAYGLYIWQKIPSDTSAISAPWKGPSKDLDMILYLLYRTFATPGKKIFYARRPNTIKGSLLGPALMYLERRTYT